MIRKSPTRFCRTCDKPLRGRSDKRFCDDSCRNFFYNHQRSPSNNLARRINHMLAKNRKIIADLLPEGKDRITVHRTKLLEQGFNFRYITHLFLSHSRELYYYCYDVGYLPVEKDFCVLVRTMKE